jgi:hypothetical protein
MTRNPGAIRKGRRCEELFDEPPGTRADQVAQIDDPAPHRASRARETGIRALGAQSHAEQVGPTGRLDDQGTLLKSGQAGKIENFEVTPLHDALRGTEIYDQVDAAVRKDAGARVGHDAVHLPDGLDGVREIIRPAFVLRPCAEDRCVGDGSNREHTGQF